MKKLCVLFAIVFIAAISSSAAEATPDPNDSNLFSPSSAFVVADNDLVDPMMFQGYICYVATDGGRLNIRSIPSTSGRIVGKLANGTDVRVVGVADEWSKISRRGRVLGWVLSYYLDCGDI